MKPKTLKELRENDIVILEWEYDNSINQVISLVISASNSNITFDDILLFKGNFELDYG